jgi:2-dehydropantoate 2-reductase
MRFLCFGAGAVGTYIGGSLALAGQPVTFIDSPQTAAAIRQNGLHLDLGEGDKFLPNPDICGSIRDVPDLSKYDIALVAVKSYDTATLIDDLKPIVSSYPPFLCLQNGVENEALFAAAIGPAKVISGSITSAVGRQASGSIILERKRGIGISGTLSIVPSLIEGMNIAGLNAKRYGNPKGMKWSKMLTNLLANASSAILDMPPAEIFAHPGLYRLEVGMLKEALAVMDAQRIPVINLPGTPVWWLVWFVRSLPLVLSQKLLMNSLGKGRGTKMPSFHIDLYAGRKKSEVAFLNGAVVRAGERTHIPTPINRWLTTILMGMVGGTIDTNRFRRDPAKLLLAAENLH